MIWKLCKEKLKNQKNNYKENKLNKNKIMHYIK